MTTVSRVPPKRSRAASKTSGVASVEPLSRTNTVLSPMSEAKTLSSVCEMSSALFQE